MKNQVDAETMMAFLKRSQWVASERADDADVVIVNSCAFIESAKQESINALLTYRKRYPAKKIVLAGCLAQRYAQELSAALPEADVFFGNNDLSRITDAVSAAINKGQTLIVPDTPVHDEAVLLERPLLSPPGSAYLKISEGCSNHCTFCSIPLIRGELRSRPIDAVVSECQTLLARGAKELCLIGQDIASYGRERSASLPALLAAISELSGAFWVRLLYLHPDHLPLALLDRIKDDPRILPYFDIPFQHGSDRILAAMGRRKTASENLALIARIRESLPDAVIRSTFLLGFPGETNADVKALLDFQEEARLDWLGCFTYSREENTPAWAMKPRVPKKIAEARKALVEAQQSAITEARLERFIGRSVEVLVEEPVEGENLSLGRLFCQAPEVDGLTLISADSPLQTGAFVRGHVVARAGFDLKMLVPAP